MLNRSLTLLLFLITALPLAAQTDTQPPAADPLSAPLPEGVSSAVRFTVEGYTYGAGEQSKSFNHPIFAQVSAEPSLHRFDVIVRDAQTENQIRNLWHFRAVFLFNDMAKFNEWYQRPQTTAIIEQFTNLGAKSLQMKFENIRHPGHALVPKRSGGSN